MYNEREWLPVSPLHVEEKKKVIFTTGVYETGKALTVKDAVAAEFVYCTRAFVLVIFPPMITCSSLFHERGKYTRLAAAVMSC